ncbi:MAG: Ig-like domain-containing protein, partial [Oscillospiraceae bacterium]|nr:Ig-like domain-containing protein [Oscillospiraceae bacterium]
NNNRGRIQVRTAETGGAKVTDSFVSYESNNPEVLEVDDAGVIEAISVGEATVTATVGNATLTAKVKVFEQDQELSNAFDATIEKNVSYDAPTVTGVTVDGGVIKSANSNGTFTLTADAEKNGNKFLYWAKGNTLGKKIISFSNEITNYMPESNDKNHILIAVYEGDVPEKEEWYNANGQRIATDTAPALPSMAGYGEAEGWDDYTDKIHVARYASKTPTAGINVTVVGENTRGGGTNLTYGDSVTCEATGDNFKCWTKTGINGKPEIVSVEKVYEFQAWETCTVTALYQDDFTYKGNTMKIIIDTFTAGSEKAVMAEFIGFGDKAVEKGIIWNNTKIAMTKPGTQFTLTGVAGDTFTGYAIVDNGDGTYNAVTDGSVTIAE